MNPGDSIGKYKLVTRLGQGGMGEVWLAQASGYGGFAKQVVLKTLLPEYSDDPLYVEMLVHEARTCALLHHPNLIEVFDFAKIGRTYLLAMEHVVGESIAQIMRVSNLRGWPLPAWFALRVAWECCRGLESAHEAGVIHCDLSPSNVMVTFTGITKIVDFGVAHSTHDGDTSDRLKGKFSYMAPERLKSLKTDRRTDVYALGVMLYLLFTGRLPFVADSDAELVRKKLGRPPAPSTHGPIDPAIEDLILQALEPDPELRFQSCTEMLQALAPCLAGQLGTYGQHDAAAYLQRLFADDTPLEPPQPGEIDLASLDIEIESSAALAHEELSIAIAPDRARSELAFDDLAEGVVQRAMTAPGHSSAFARIGRGSDRIVALDRPVIAPTPPPAPPPPAPPVDALHEPRTRVQSLFGGDRRHPIADGDAPASDWRWPWPASRSK